ncbi:hypothetical protein [Paracoccus aminophilus]|uniref:Uncharacterized protein n=1 Tax=Paracoccus aminophilus JCM 7686 TaxID=1367847 RepID=S5Y2J3_PARAH|nr:hypothetical protein [Paracoccus aminophilus]AGT09965.1 hypothetical protein JCM7686_2910 [Paracoccus aminophilus JCM 7686]
MIEPLKELLPLIIAAISVVVWLVRLEGRVSANDKGDTDRLDRHEARLRGLEQSIQSHALQMVRVEEALSGIKLTLDRIYTEMRERG